MSFFNGTAWDDLTPGQLEIFNLWRQNNAGGLADLGFSANTPDIGVYHGAANHGMAGPLQYGGMAGDALRGSQGGWFDKLGGMEGIGTGLQGLASLYGIYAGLQGLKEQKRLNNFQMGAWKKNFNNMVDERNQYIRDRYQSRAAASPYSGNFNDLDTYMKENALKHA